MNNFTTAAAMGRDVSKASLTLRTCTCMHVVIEHVDFYDGTHTDCSHARLDLCVVLHDFCCNCTQYRAVPRNISIVSITACNCSDVRPRAWSYVRARGSAWSMCMHVRSVSEA